MSKLQSTTPTCIEKESVIRVLVQGKSKDLGGFSVRRVLPAPLARSVGPFVFVDEMGPADFPPGQGINVRPHPHIGLATVTYLLDGEIMHRDSLGYVQAIQPGAVNLMTAGNGIVHSERTAPELLHNGQRLHGMQVWMALPEDQQEIEPSFVHYPNTCLPVITSAGVNTTVIIGNYAGNHSPVAVHAKTLYLAMELEHGASHALESDEEQTGVYVVKGSVAIDGHAIQEGEMAVLAHGRVEISSTDASYIMVMGGENLAPRRMYWNFVHTSRERIEQAVEDWRNGNFTPVPGDDEFIPLPG